MTTDIGKYINDKLSAIEAEPSEDGLLTARNLLDLLKELVKEASTRWEAAAMEWLNQGGTLRCGDIEYRITSKRTEKCRDSKAVLKTLMSSAGLEEIDQCLAANAWKPASMRKVLQELGIGEAYEELFETRMETDLQGKPVKQVQRVNTQFIQKGK